MSDLPFLDDPDWSLLAHAYGSAVDTPGQLEALRSTDPEARRSAWSGLIGSANHQGDLYTATPWIVGPLVDLAVDLEYPDRLSAVAHATLIVEGLFYTTDRPSNPGTEPAALLEAKSKTNAHLLAECRRAAVEYAHNVYDLVQDDDPDMRCWALRLVGVIARTGVDLPHLRSALNDQVPRVRAIALWQVHITESAQHDEAARFVAEADSNSLEYFVANAVLLASDRNSRFAARELLRLQDVVGAEFERAGLHHVSDSPFEFAATLAKVGSELELEELAY